MLLKKQQRVLSPVRRRARKHGRQLLDFIERSSAAVELPQMLRSVEHTWGNGQQVPKEWHPESSAKY